MIPNQPGTYGISKRLSDDERKRLRKILDEIRPARTGSSSARPPTAPAPTNWPAT